MSEPKLVKIHTTFRNTEATAAIKEYAEEKLGLVIKKFVHQNTEAHVTIKVEKNDHIAEIVFHTDGTDFACKEKSGDMYASIDKLVDVVATQLRKHKEKITAHHA